MSVRPKNSTSENFYSGRFAEFVSSPSLLTYSFIADWFTGEGSLGKGMKLLHMPYQDVDLPILVLKDNELIVNLAREEQTLYQKTVFRYKQQQDIHTTPVLTVDFIKLLNPLCLINTLRIILIQSQWIANPEVTGETAQKLIDMIPTEKAGATIQEIDTLLKDKVWPNVLAIGLVSEFYNQFIIKEAKEHVVEINEYISTTIAKDDWFFRSLADQEAVKQKKMTFADYIEKYGLRSDKDYELASPRWHEIQKIIKQRIEKNSGSKINKTVSLNTDKKLQKFIDTAINLQLLRSEAKRRALVHISNLRELILKATDGMNDISQITKKDLLSGQIPRNLPAKNSVKKESIKKSSFLATNTGIIVSQGFAIGLVKHIVDSNITIPKGTIGVFSNASPEFAVQYPKCDGMIFLRGGQLSHGAIVAREYGIPAIIDSEAQYVPENAKLTLNGNTGEWHIG